MALDFPASPTNGQVYPAPNGVAYQWQVPPSLWVAVGGSTGGGVPPSGPAGGDLAGTYPSPTIKPSVALTGNPTAPTPAAGDADTSIATTAFVQANSSIISVPAERFGAVGDGVHDDTAALQAAVDYLAAQGGGQLQLTKRYLIDSANLNLKTGVFLTGFWRNNGERPGLDYSTVQSAIILNPAYTVRCQQPAAGVNGLAFFKKGLTQPTTLRQALDLGYSFAGTAITNGPGGMDFYVGYCFFGGFQYGLNSGGSERIHIEYIQGDCTNGIYVTTCWDMIHVSHCHFWPFLIAHMTTNIESHTITGAANNGSGLIRLTLAEIGILRTGDSVSVIAPNGLPNSQGRWNITVIDATHIDLQGSTWGGSFIAGGAPAAVLNSWYRSGVAYNFDYGVDWGQMDHCFSFDYGIGFRIHNCSATTLLNCGADAGGADGDTSIIGILLDGDGSLTTLIGCKTASQGTSLQIDLAGAAQVGTVTVNNHRFWGPPYGYRRAVRLIHGSVTFNNCVFDATETVQIETTATAMKFAGGDVTNAAFFIVPGAPQPSFVEVVGVLNQFHSFNLIPDPAAAPGGTSIFFATQTADAHALLLDTFSDTFRAYTARKSDNFITGLWNIKLDGSLIDFGTVPLKTTGATTLGPIAALSATLSGTIPPTSNDTTVPTTAWVKANVSGGGGTGTVTSTSVVSANGLAGTVATATTTPAITLSTTVTGMLKGNGTAISAGTAGTDYMTPANVSAAYQPLDADLTALAGLNATAGLVEQTAAATYTKRLIGVANTTDIPTRANADARYAPISVNGTVTSTSVVSANGFAGTVATATTTPAITLSTSITGMLKGNGTAISAGVAGTDYITPAGLPTSLPPSGTAGGGLAGTYPNPTIKPSITNGDVLTTVAGVATWAAASGGSGSYLPLTGGTLTGPLAGTVATFSGGDFAVVRGVDTPTAAIFSGVTKGVRIGFDGVTSYIQGVDNTGFTSFQPLQLGGTAITLAAPVTGSTATFAANQNSPAVVLTVDNTSTGSSSETYIRQGANGKYVDRTVNATSAFFWEKSTTGINARFSDFDTHNFRNNAGTTVATVTATAATFSGTVMAPGAQIQMVSTETGAVATGTTTIPADDTIPQSTEGDQYMTLAITPKSATSKLVIEALWQGSFSATGVFLITVALFQDATAGALAATWAPSPASGAAISTSLRHVMTSGTTSATTFKIRVGGNTAGTTTFNGFGGGRLYGGVMASSIVIREVAP